MQRRALLALEEPDAQRVRPILEDLRFRTFTVEPDENLVERARAELVDVVLVSESRLSDGEVEPMLGALREASEPPDTVVFATRDDEAAHAAWRAQGCYAIFGPTAVAETLHESLRTLAKLRKQSHAARFHAERIPRHATRLSDFVSASPTMSAFLQTARRVASADTPLLILGETGVGKEHLARAIHIEGSRARGPFVPVHCGALPEGLLESELFGHEEGAFTGAQRARRGNFELAHRGTLFLDEIGEVPAHLQVKLLRALESTEIRRLGGERAIPVDVRLIAATNRDLAADVEAGGFRRDLYYRLNVVTLTVPPLRERREDIPGLVERYRAHFAKRLGRAVRHIPEATMLAFVNYAWPGNVRELINVVERAVLLAEGDTMDLALLPDEITTPDTARGARVDSPLETQPAASTQGDLDRPWAEARGAMLHAFERTYLDHLLRTTRGRVGEAAERAGIQPRSLFDKMREHGLRKEDYRS